MRFERLVTRGRELLTLGEVDRAAYLLTQALALWRGEAFADVESLATGRRRGPAARGAAAGGGGAAGGRPSARGPPRGGAGRGPGAGAGGSAAGTPMDAARAGPVPVGRPGRGAAHDPPAQVRARPAAGDRRRPRRDGPRAGDPAPGRRRSSGPALAPSAATCPWQGLTPYGEGDADPFFGRDDDVDSCLEILRRTSCSSWSARRGAGSPRCCAPGSRPRCGDGQTQSRSRPVAPDGDDHRAAGPRRTRTVLVVDQFEEVFSLCADADERQEFLEALDGRGRRDGPWSWRCGPTGWRTSPSIRRSAASSSGACYLVGGSRRAICARRSRARPGRRAC